MKISLAQLDVDELRSLWTWLADEPRVRRFGQMRWSEPSKPEAMGSLEAISLSVASGLSVAQLVVALMAWRDSRATRNITVVIEYREQRAVLDGSDQASLDRAVKTLTAEAGTAKAAVRSES